MPVAAPGSFDYRIPPELQDRLAAGHAVTVPFGRRRLTGYVLGVDLARDRAEGAGAPRELKSVVALEIEQPLFPPELVPLFRWMADYYAHPLGEVVRTALPGATRGASRDVARLLPEGRDALNSNELPEDLRALLERLMASSSSAVAVSSLRRRDGIASSVVQRGVREGYIERGQAPSKAAVRVRTEAMFSLVGEAREARQAFPRPGPVRDRLIDYIARFGPVSRSDIKEAFPTATAALRQLQVKDLLLVEQREIRPDAAERVVLEPSAATPHALMPAQREALEALVCALDAEPYQCFLLHGVTGSGKTEVYLQAAAEVLKRGESALLLVPEIGLTPQFLGRFRARFGEREVAVLHSGLTARERFDEWLRIARGEARLVVGPRSAVFAPVRRLGLVVVDEEHDGSYKQDSSLRYNARDVAVVRAMREKAVVVLGSATPSLESLHNAELGRYEKLSLPERVAGRSMPQIELVDLRRFPVADPDEAGACLSPPMREALAENLAEGGQAILLLNRRGFATTVLCTSCGQHFRCSECDLSMTYHGRRHQVLCHLCGQALPLPEDCPGCSGYKTLNLVGRGTERLEEELLALWPQLRVDRMDTDTTRSRASHRRILDRFRRGEVDVLVGTQMVAKGHDFPGVTLVGVLHADSALHMPDFRASERTFQLVSQVAGRAGRGERPGRVLVQTWHPGHHAIRLALDHDFDGFVEREMRLRRGLWYPPYARLCMFRISAKNERQGTAASRACRDRVEEVARTLVTGPGQLRILGPSPAPIYRAKGRFRWQVSVKACDHQTMGRLLSGLAPALFEVVRTGGGDSRLAIDRDPMDLL